MNKHRRKAIYNCIKLLSSQDPDLESIEYDITSILEEEDEYRDNMPENLQGGERYSDSEAASDSLNDAILYIQDAISDENESSRKESIKKAILALGEI